MPQYQYVPAKTSHLLHFIITVCTFGLWFPVWMGIALYNHNRTVLKVIPNGPTDVPPYFYYDHTKQPSVPMFVDQTHRPPHGYHPGG